MVNKENEGKYIVMGNKNNLPYYYDKNGALVFKPVKPNKAKLVVAVKDMKKYLIERTIISTSNNHVFWNRAKKAGITSIQGLVDRLNSSSDFHAYAERVTAKINA